MSRIAPVLASARQRLLAVRRTGARPPRICGRPPISPCAGQKELSIPPVVPIQERAALRSVGAHSSGAPACEVRGTSWSPGHLGPRRILGHPPVRPPLRGAGRRLRAPSHGNVAARRRAPTDDPQRSPGSGSGRTTGIYGARRGIPPEILAGTPPDPVPGGGARAWKARHRAPHGPQRRRPTPLRR